MKVRTILLTFGVAIILLFSALPTNIIEAVEPSAPFSISPDQYEQGYRYNVQGWIYLHIEGEPFERGYQHGYLLAAEIVDMLNRWSNLIHNYPKFHFISKRLSEERYYQVSASWWGFCVSRVENMYWDKIPEEYKQEMQGIADGVTARGGTIHGKNVTVLDILTMNEMYEFMSKMTRIPKKIHPMRTFFHQLQKIVPETAAISEDTFLDEFLNQDPAHHCDGFIATGNATTNGQIVVAQSTICGGGMWWWTYYISLRWNVILDLQPSKGNRIMMPTSPGLIWSDEDYYQNDIGIVLLETTIPQGMFDNIGLPLSVRVRNAMQYGTSINDVVYYLRYRNDGSMDAVWLVGDMKTGEIARFELGYKAFAIWRTFNGFHWSANNPVDIHLRIEKFNPKLYLKTLMYRLVKIPGFWFHSIRYKPETRDVKYKELGERYYGNIDVNIVKEISFTPPISTWITDCKISDTTLVKNNGLWAYFGNPLKTLNITSFDTVNETIESVEPCGWVRLFGVPSKENFTLLRQKREVNTSTSILWKYDTKQPRNDFYSNGIVDNDILYETTSAGTLYAMNPLNGQIKWSTNPGKNLTKPIILNNLIAIGHSEGVLAYQKNGQLEWSFPSDDVTESPVLLNSSLVFGDASGVFYAVHPDTGQELWRMNWSNQTLPAAQTDGLFFVTAGDSCYALDETTHDLVWRYETKGMITAPPVLADGTVYVYSWDTFVYALDAYTGELKWSYETGFGSDISPVYRDGLLFVGSADNNLYAFDAEAGELFWMFTCNAAIHSSPVMYGDYVFFGSDDGHVYTLDWLTGEPAWTFTPGSSIENTTLHTYITTPILSNVVLWNKTVYFGAKGILYGLDAQTIELPPDDGTNDSSNNDTENPEDNENNTDNQQDNETHNPDQNETNTTDPDQQEEELAGFNPLLAVIGGGGILLLLIILYVVVRKRRQVA